LRHAIGTTGLSQLHCGDCDFTGISRLDNALPLRVVLVLDEIDDGVDLLGVNVPLRQNEFLPR
jgi:hypothetical protein